MRNETIEMAAVLMPIDVERTAALQRSVQTFGFADFDAAIAPATFDALRAEARASLPGALEAERSADGAERPEGAPRSYRAGITGLGPAALGFLTDAAVLQLLRDYFGGDYALSEGISCLTFYASGGHLGAHLDRPAEDCAVTIIIYLDAVSPDAAAPDTGLVLMIYGEDEASVGEARLRIPTRAGSIVLGRGSQVWHERPPLRPGESVVAITGCFRQLT